MQGGWKLIHYLQPGVGDEFYDTATDPEELHNRIAVPDAAGRLADLQRALGAELDRTRAGFGIADRQTIFSKPLLRPARVKPPPSGTRNPNLFKT